MIAIANTNALYRLLDPQLTGHETHRKALVVVGHLIVSPIVLAELDHLIAARAGARQALSAVIAVAEDYADAGGDKGVRLTDAMNVALAAAYRTDVPFTTDRHFRMIRPLIGHAAFRLLSDDL
ncbi:PIN domain-containing protein [Streptomyces sp. NPDC001719]